MFGPRVVGEGMGRCSGESNRKCNDKLGRSNTADGPASLRCNALF